MYEISTSGPFFWANVSLLAIVYLAWVAFLGGISTVWSVDKDSVTLGIVWFAVWLQFVVAIIYTPVVLGKRSIAHLAYTLLVIVFILEIVVLNSVRTLIAPTQGTGKLHSGVKTLFGSLITLTTANGLLVLLTTGEVEALITGHQGETYPSQQPKKVDEDVEASPEAAV